ncbi:Rne/Rng family ribonuclease [Metabacillus malikii]|uniref:Ribonuclease G n=1 Tax=Metabacillus malikii TaxID=1504265 RepID=A0ABT9ZLQ3_9BACI|nr:Rne/Rng family ribonuclease [Metabacillus malikii]MDQ0232834.1 ribonuclease G [Metabacillus malikii]
MRKFIINEKTTEVRCALIENEQLKEIHQTYSVQEEIVGNIYLGRVTKVLPGMQAAFVDIGVGQNGYLHRNDVMNFQVQRKVTPEKSSISNYVHEGEQVLVQVVKEGNEQKGPKLTTNIEFSGNLLVFMPFGNYIAVSKKIDDENERTRLYHIGNELRGEQEGFLFRTASNNHAKEILKAEYDRLKGQFERIKRMTSKRPVCLHEASNFIERILNEHVITNEDQIICDNFDRVQKLKEQYPQEVLSYYDQKEGIFSRYKVEAEIEKLFKQIVWLKNGAYIVIEQTEAMTIIDVNTGKFSGKLSMRDTVIETNRHAAIEIAKQIRLRNLSGIILVDFIDMKHKEDRDKILQTIKHSMREDRVQHKVIGFTELNILQMTRKKVREPITMSMTSVCPTCTGTGRIISAETVAFKLERELWEYQYMDNEAIWIEATADVIELLTGTNNDHLHRLESSLKYKLIISSCEGQVSSYQIKHIGSLEEIKARLA